MRGTAGQGVVGYGGEAITEGPAQLRRISSAILSGIAARPPRCLKPLLDDLSHQKTWQWSSSMMNNKIIRPPQVHPSTTAPPSPLDTPPDTITHLKTRPRSSSVMNSALGADLNIRLDFSQT